MQRETVNTSLPYDMSIGRQHERIDVDMPLPIVDN